MATEKQIAANRANAQHCTGPKTEEGKANSSKNSFKHGLDAKSEIIRYEKREDYDKLIAEYYARFNPATPEERALVDDLIKSEWHGRRFHAVDALVLDRAIENVPSGNLGIAYTNCAATLSRVERRINSAQRNFQRALKQLLELQANRPELSAVPEAAQTETTQNPPEPDTQNTTLNPKSVSFSTIDESPAELSIETPLVTPITEENPPIAA
jgi:hypothetical protein